MASISTSISLHQYMDEPTTHEIEIGLLQSISLQRSKCGRDSNLTTSRILEIDDYDTPASSVHIHFLTAIAVLGGLFPLRKESC